MHFLNSLAVVGIVHQTLIDFRISNCKLYIFFPFLFGIQSCVNARSFKICSTTHQLSKSKEMNIAEIEL